MLPSTFAPTLFPAAKPRSRVLASSLVLASTLGTACSNTHGPTNSVDTTKTDRDAGTTPPGLTDAGKEPAFIVATRVWDDSSTRSYFQVVHSLARGTTVDSSQAIEVAGSARLFSFEGLGWFGLGGAEEPTITRFKLNDKNALVEDVTISLAQYGVGSLWPDMYFVSSEKVYYPDRDGQQLIIWNPSKMQVEGAIALPGSDREGYLANYGYSSVLRGTKLLFSIGWFDWQANDSIVGETGLVVIDTTTDTLERIDVDTRCAGITHSIDMPSGDTYFVSSALAAAAYKLNRLDVEPCALRVNKGEAEFDAEYAVRLSKVTDGALAGDPIPGPGGKMFIRVLDEDVVSVEEGALTYEITSQPAWRWMLWDPVHDSLEPVAALPNSPANVSWFSSDGATFTIEEKSEPFESTLIELTAEGGPAMRLTVEGYLHGLARVQ